MMLNLLLSNHGDENVILCMIMTNFSIGHFPPRTTLPIPEKSRRGHMAMANVASKRLEKMGDLRALRG
jgi:hypothetical protein